MAWIQRPQVSPLFHTPIFGELGAASGLLCYGNPVAVLISVDVFGA
ncbi:hypothetical protein [Actinoplanes sp. ATCC 53533]|nr:hypothetical protein [Actinoplanes sp. ATCC 53533]